GGGADFPTTSGALQSAYGGGATDAFVTRLNPSGASLWYSSYLGGSGTDTGAGVADDAFGNAYPVGTTGSSNFPTLHALQGSLAAAGTDAWYAELSPLPAAPVFTSVTGGAGRPFGQVTDHQTL